MAPETHSLDKLGDLERRLDSQVVALEGSRRQMKQASEIGDLKQAMLRIEGCLQEINNNLKNGSPSGMGEQQGGSTGSFVHQPSVQFGTYHLNNNGYIPPTRHCRVEFPHFDGTDFRGWSYRCRQFFAVDGTPVE